MLRNAVLVALRNLLMVLVTRAVGQMACALDILKEKSPYVQGGFTAGNTRGKVAFQTVVLTWSTAGIG